MDGARWAALAVLAVCAGCGIAAEDGAAALEEDLALAPEGWRAPVEALGAGPPVLFLEFDGARLTHADSFIVPAGRGAVDIPPFDPGPYGLRDRRAAIEWVEARVAEHFADTGLRVTTTRPDGGHTTVVVGGRPEAIGRPRGLAGIAPFDPGDRSPADVAFAFAGGLGRGRGRVDLDQLAAVIAHEAGHSYGLTHDVERDSLMFSTLNDDMERFLAAERLDGGWQDAPAILRRVLGEPGAAAPCRDDTAEPNDERAQAAPLLPDDVPLRLCPGDDDWYQLHLEAGVEVDVRIRHAAGAALAPPDVYRPRGRTPLGAPYAEDDAVGVRLLTPSTGTYRLRISGDAAVDYRLEVRPAPTG